MQPKFLQNAILKFNPEFSEAVLNAGIERFQQSSYAAKAHILRAGEICDSLYIANQSVSRCYYHDETGEEKTIWMEPPHLFITDFESFTQATPSPYNLQFYQETEAWAISRQDLRKLYQQYPEWAIWGINLMEHYHVRILDLFATLFQNNATQNYQYIEQHFAHFLQVAPLKDIASMLNLSPITLSRIRAGTQTKK